MAGFGLATPPTVSKVPVASAPPMAKFAVGQFSISPHGEMADESDQSQGIGQPP